MNPSISKASGPFFLAWVTERMQALKLEDFKQLAALMRHHQQARACWKALVEKALVRKCIQDTEAVEKIIDRAISDWFS